MPIPLNPELLARVREDIDSAKENGHDLLAPEYGLSDMEINLDMRGCTTGYEDVPEDELIAAIAAVRKERVS